MAMRWPERTSLWRFSGLQSVMQAGWWIMASMVLLAGSAMAQSEGLSCPPAARYAPEMFTRAAQHPGDRGFLWRIERDGRYSYLFGSMHVGRAEWMGLGPGVRRALQEVDALALEIDMTSAQAQQQLQQVTARAPRTIPPPLRDRLKRLWVAQCMSLAQFDSAPVELQAITLMALAGRQHGLDPAYGSEVLLTMAARADNVPVVSLESVTAQMELFLATSNAEASEAVAQALDELESPRTLAKLDKLTSAWARSDLDVMASYGDWCDCLRTERQRADMKKLLDDRNPGLAEGIERLHASGQRVFAAVGALHMTGTMGLPSLLAGRGFKVARVY
jgi:uncharacterized protein